MSVKVMSAVWERDDLDASERLVMLALADHADDEGRCYPSIARLCKRTSMTDRGVQKVVARLVEKGFVSIAQNGGRAGSNLYTVTADPEPRSPRTTFTPRTGFTTPPEPRSENPRTTFTQTVIEPSVEPSLVPLCVSPASKRRKPEVPIPPDWVPSDRNLSDAKDRNFSASEIDHEARQFRDYHLSKDNRYRDWDAAWRTWLGNAARRGKASPRNTGAGAGHSALFAGFQRAAGG